MKIAFVTGHYFPYVGGIESHVEQIARRLAARGDEVTVLTQTDDRGWPREAMLDGVFVRRFPVPVPSRHFAISPSLWWTLRNNKSKWDIIHAHGYHSAVSFLASSSGACPLIFTPHYHGTGHSPLRKALHIPYRSVGGTVLRNAVSVICVSQAERELLLQHFPWAIAKTTVIPNGVDLQELQRADAFPVAKRIIITGGRLESYKKVDLVVQAVALLGDEWELVITGDGPERSRLEALVKALRLEHQVRFVGRIPVRDLYRWYQTAEIYVSMSLHEAMPVTLLEVLACGARVVCSDIPAHVDLKEKTNGPVIITSSHSSAEDVTQAIQLAMKAPSSQDVYVPTWDDVTTSTRRIYDTVLKRGEIS